jgi:hypothetical protein
VSLTAAEYERGVVSWTPDAPIEVHVQLPAAEDGSPRWSAALPDPTGSRVPAEFDSVEQLGISGPGFTNLVLQGMETPFEVRLEYQERGRVRAYVFRGPDPTVPGFISRTKLNDIPRFGRFFRLVVYTPHLSWAEDMVFRTDGLLVRFTDTIFGNRMRRFHQQEQDGQVALAFEQLPGPFAGRFIEIVAPSSEGDPSGLAFSVLGRIAAMLGFNAIGEIAIAEEVEHLPSQDKTATIIPFVPNVPSTIDADAFANLDAGLARIHAPTLDPEKALGVALRWYERGMRLTSPLDGFLSFFVALEALIRGYTEQYGYLPVEREREERYRDVLLGLQQTLNKDTYNRVRDAYVSANLADHVRFYATERGLPPEFMKRFRSINRLRGPLLHGGSSPVTAEQAGVAQLLVEEVIAVELAATR